jgi:hypothetical protein
MKAFETIIAETPDTLTGRPRQHQGFLFILQPGIWRALRMIGLFKFRQRLSRAR